MRLTNKHGAPEALVAAIKADPYFAGGAELTASSIATPPRIRALFRLHAGELEEDVSDRIWALLGQSVHVLLERAGRTEIREKRLYAKVAGADLSAQLDSVTVVGGKITEWKLTSVWTVVYGGREDWLYQMNTQAEILARNGVEPTALQVVAILRDWSKSKAELAEAKRQQGGDDAYPPVPFAIYDVPLWSAEKREAYISERVRLHREAGLGILPDCTDEERWIRKPGQAPTRCLSWCAVAPWCDQLERWKAARAPSGARPAVAASISRRSRR